MPFNKYDLYGMFNDLLARGDNMLEAIDKLSMTNGVDKEDLLDMDNTFLGGMMHDTINNSPFSSSSSYEPTGLVDDILSPKDPTDSLFDDLESLTPNYDPKPSNPFDDSFDINKSTEEDPFDIFNDDINDDGGSSSGDPFGGLF